MPLALKEGLSAHIAVDPPGTRWLESFKLGYELMIAGLSTENHPKGVDR